jgi:hypothetical protein
VKLMQLRGVETIEELMSRLAALESGRRESHRNFGSNTFR